LWIGGSIAVDSEKQTGQIHAISKYSELSFKAISRFLSYDVTSRTQIMSSVVTLEYCGLVVQ
jgi:hypothetical protein